MRSREDVVGVRGGVGERGEQGWEVTGKKQSKERRWGKGGKGGRQEGKKEEPRGRSMERGKKGQDENLGIRCRERKGDRKELEERCRQSQAKKNKAANIYRLVISLSYLILTLIPSHWCYHHPFHR